MALPSQQARPTTRRNLVYRAGGRQRRSRALAAIFVVALAIGALAWWRLSQPDGEPDAGTRAAAPQETDAVNGGTQETEPIAPPPLATPEREDVSADSDQPDRGLTKVETPGTHASAGRGVPESSGARSGAPVSITDSPSTGSATRAMALVASGEEQLARKQFVQARRTLSSALDSGELAPSEASRVRDRLSELSARMIFGPEINADDPFVMRYEIKGGDALSALPKRLGLQIEWQFLKRINRIANENNVHAGRAIKVVTGPFHAVVYKRAYRMDLYIGEDEDRVYLRSFAVGLGADNGTPEGRFRVRSGSKLLNPEWVNPRTRERYAADDPANPIGEHWIGLEGDEPHLKDVAGYGIHGTVEPDSIGRQASMGCVRMNADDVALIWELLTRPASTITIVP